jgi:type I restriction enzyme S subunit
MKPYPAYKDSGIEWLGEIPEHWEIKKLKYLSTLLFSNVDKKKYDDESEVKSCNYVDVYKNDYITENIDFLEITATKSEISKFSIQKGDVLVTKDSETANDIAVPALVKQELSNIVCGYHLSLIRPKKLQGDYLFRLFQSSVNEHFTINAKGVTRYGLGLDAFYNVYLPTPPLSEQQSIATFLYQKTSQIDTLIEKKQKQIELLKEERIAIINQAVTKGLNLDVPMKDSGIEWLGEVPEHWEIKKLKYLANQSRDKKETYGSLKIALENIESWTGKLVNLDSDTAFESEGIVFNAEDVLFGKLRPYLAKVHKAHDAGICVSEILVLEHSHFITSDFLYYRCLSEDFIKEVNSSTYGSKMPRANWDFISNLSIPFPNHSEQNSITDLIDSAIKTSNKLIDEIQKQITFLHEYRTALISNAVTGKIDVRNTAEVIQQ